MRQINILIGSDGSVSADNLIIGRAGEHLATTLALSLPSDWLQQVNYYRLHMELQGKPQLTDKLTATGDTIYFPVPQAAIFAPGILKLQTVGYADDDAEDPDSLPILKSNIIQMQVLESISNGDALPNTPKSSLEAAVDEARTQAAAAIAAANQATQALSDLLAITGTDICPLVGGVVPMDKLSATATQEICSITDESQLTGLTAQHGDLAELIEEVDGERTVTKTWQLLTDDPTDRANWVVWGTSYAVQSGHATTATNAENANMLNGHRLIYMTQEQYDAARAGGTIDDNADYSVSIPEVL